MNLKCENGRGLSIRLSFWTKVLGAMAVSEEVSMLEDVAALGSVFSSVELERGMGEVVSVSPSRTALRLEAGRS